LPFLVFILLSVAFLTLFERKGMGSMQRRRGPNVVGFFGLAQPIADGLNFFLKKLLFLFLLIFFFIFNFSFYFFFCSFVFLSCYSFFRWVDYFWCSFQYFFRFCSFDYFCLFFNCIWLSQYSKYAFLGALRSAAQLISYEIVIMLTLLPIFFVSSSLNLNDIVLFQYNCWIFLFFFLLFY